MADQSKDKIHYARLGRLLRPFSLFLFCNMLLYGCNSSREIRALSGYFYDYFFQVLFFPHSLYPSSRLLQFFLAPVPVIDPPQVLDDSNFPVSHWRFCVLRQVLLTVAFEQGDLAGLSVGESLMSVFLGLITFWREGVCGYSGVSRGSGFEVSTFSVQTFT